MNSSLDTHAKANYLNYVKGNKKKGTKGKLSISNNFPKNLNPNKFNENLPLKQNKVRTFQKFTIQRRKGEGFNYKIDLNKNINKTTYGDIIVTNTINKDFNEGNNYKVVKGVPNVVAGYRVKKNGESVVSGGYGKNAYSVAVETFTMYIDVTGIVNANKSMGSGKNAYYLTKTVSDAVKKEFGSDGKHDPKIHGWGGKGVFSMGKDAGKKGNPLYKKSGSLTGQQSGSEEFKQKFAKIRQDYFDTNAQIDYDNKNNATKNKYAKKINDLNKKYNRINKDKKEAYAQAIKISKTTKGADYVDRRDEIEAIKALKNLDIPNSEKKKILNDVENVFKDFYRGEKLKKFNFGYGKPKGYAETKGKPLYNAFDSNYYKKQTIQGASMTEQEKWKEAVANDDIDIIERFGDTKKDAEFGFYLYRYGQQRGPGEVRGNAAEKTDLANEYTEAAPTDAQLQQIRDDYLRIEKDDPVEIINSVKKVKQLWNQTKKAKKQGDTDNELLKLAGDAINIDNPDEFLLVLRQASVNDEEGGAYKGLYDKLVQAGMDSKGNKISELEDVITGVVGEEAILQTKKMGALTQNVLIDTIEELKKAKAKEQELALFNNFGGFGEIMDVNKSLSDSLLGDLNVGGYLPLTGFDPDKLEKGLSGVTGVNNNIVYNWEKWFDDSIQKNYSEFEGDYIKLGFSKEDAKDKATEDIKVQRSFAESYVQNYLKPRFDESRSMNEFVEYLDVRDEEQNPFQTQTLVNAVQELADLRGKSFFDSLKDAEAGNFNADYYFDPAAKYNIKDEKIRKQAESRYADQKNTIASDWDTARDNPNKLIDKKKPGLGTWAEAIYRYGTDVNNKKSFAKLHYQIKGRNKGFDPARDAVNPLKVKDYIYDKLLPELVDEAGNPEVTKNIFGKFILPEEFADDMLKGLNPEETPEEWQKALDSVGLSDFKGTTDELKGYIAEVFRTGSAEDIRAQIKYLNERRKDPDQYLLGVEYIDREEDYKPANKLQGDTQLYKIFQDAGYKGTEDDFYTDVFPDLDPSTQTMLSQAGSEDGTVQIAGLGTTDFDKDPFTAFSTIGGLFGDNESSNIFSDFSQPETETDQEDDEDIFSFSSDNDSSSYFGSYKKSKSAQDILDTYTSKYKTYF